MSTPINSESVKIKFNVKEIGKVSAVREFIVLAQDMPSCINGQIVEFERGLRGMVMGFTEKDVQILMLGPKAQIRAGDNVYSKAQSLYLPSGEAFIGRIVNALCEPVDGKDAIEASDENPVFRDAPGVMDRMDVERTLESGTRIIDTIMPLAKGQRQLIIGDRQTGKTTIATDAIINQKGKEVICIYCSIGKTHSSLMKIIALFQEKGCFDYTIVINGTASCSVGEQYLAPYTACTLGEHFMYKGKDVLVIFDDLTRHAWIYRQISLLLNRAPGREAYPGDIFYLHSQLMERAAQMKQDLNGGSMTFLPLVETLQGDVTGYIPTNLVSMTDGQIYLSTTLFNSGFRPAIDTGLSVSRIGNRAQWPAMKGPSRSLRLEFLQYKELLQMTQLRTTEISKEAQKRLNRGQAISQLLIQDKNNPVEMERQVIDMYALNREVLDNLSPTEIRKFKDDFYRNILEWFPKLPQQIRDSKIIVDESIANLEEAIQYYFAQTPQ
ncbi:MAG: F0F1 ATP synthase subunit alpha [Candidatus Omnitrophica bacterium]|nr:F0F1 ATP synthase subunit alpha [Candidatus Omnitrophota bacterium]